MFISYNITDNKRYNQWIHILSPTSRSCLNRFIASKSVKLRINNFKVVAGFKQP